MRKIKEKLPFLSVNIVRYTLLSLTLISCASVGLNHVNLDEIYGKVFIPDRLVSANSKAGQHYLNTIEPILEKRCVVCHGCYDAPCQLKLSSPSGIQRGASKQQVYDGTRILSAAPTRLEVDAQTTEQWRNKAFHSILNERSQTQATNLDNSLLYQMLKLKAQAPEENAPLLGQDYSLGLDRQQSCASNEEFSDFAKQNNKWGMPYGLPAISQNEFETLKDWVAKGAALAIKPIPGNIHQQIEQWEDFLNKDSLKHQLSARYIYEHVFLGHIYFDPHPLFNGSLPQNKPSHFFKLVRSSTPPGLPIRVIPSRRPYHEPGVSRVYYRLQHVEGVIPSKIFMPYAFNDERMAWFKSLFIEPDYEVTTLPGYDPEETMNPMLTFKELPIGSRYRFMLEEAEFIIKGFIKGPVCRGQIALNVIDDHFWVSFIDPEFQSSDRLNEFLVSQKDNLKLPGEPTQKTQNIIKWLSFSDAHERFLHAKNQVIRERFAEGKGIDLSLIWDGGEKQNPNAALTIFRHFDSASVIRGHIGQEPKTAWVIGYPLLERIHYLLVAQFDVYGNISHQLLTRLYMDFLRMEGEFNFLAFLPPKERVRLAKHWYRGADKNLSEHLLFREKQILQTPNIQYESDHPKSELLAMIRDKLGNSLSYQYQLDRKNALHEKLAQLNLSPNSAASVMAETSIILIQLENEAQQIFTLIRNNGHSNISSLLHEEQNRLPNEDYLTLIPGIVSNYPVGFFKIKEEEIETFVSNVKALKQEQDYFELKNRFGVRRTAPDFWHFSDEVNQWFTKNDVMNAGVLDYNRLENR